jgi:hypothetical protein
MTRFNNDEIQPHRPVGHNDSYALGDAARATCDPHPGTHTRCPDGVSSTRTGVP